ncbi:MAG TPA: GntP family transporter [Intrasporangium sp.]|uniref:GntP family transporter n=1 Tax=Intrasporangium sp. TaxID=1925024 RepID=UPI002B475F6E|nr:GntP family transporter [Intrasporangium sp.]HKX66606.1 GntP family transporter [Intrasporangium sp.]
MGTLALLLTALAAVGVLLVLVIKVELPAFVSLLLVAMGTALVTGIPLEEVVPVMVAGMAKVLGSVAIIVGLGSMLGRLIEVSGGAEHLARRFTHVLGPKRVIVALTAAAFILGIPVFFDVGFIILAPIVFAFAKVAGLNPLKIGLPVGAVLLTVHVTVPPHPGPVAAAALTGADVGLLTVVGIVIAAVVAVVGFFAARIFNISKITLGPSPATEAVEHSYDDEDADLEPGSSSGGTSGGAATVTKTEPKTEPKSRIPSAGTVTALILLPILLIMIGSTLNTVLAEDSPLRPFASFVGAPTTALLVGVLVAYFVIWRITGWSKTKLGSVADSALPIVAIIIFVTGAGGVFGNVLVESGIGDALTETLTSVGMPVILAGFVLSLALRAAQGSATVAILTTAGLLANAIAEGGYTQLQVVLITLAIGFGGLGLSHINDSGFWIVTKYLGLSVADGLKTWTVLTTICGVAGFALTWLVFALV